MYGQYENFCEDKLHDRCEFFSYLKEKCISEKNYLHAINVWNILKGKKSGDYHDLYLKTDVFEKFLDMRLKYYGLDSCHYFRSPGLSWDALLKMTEIELELVSNSDMYLLCEKGMTGGISYISKRFIKANNRYTLSYDDNKPSKYIMYLEANSLYWFGNKAIFTL